MGQHPLSSVSTRIFKSLRKGLNLIPSQGQKRWKKGYLLKKAKNLGKGGVFGPSNLIKKQYILWFQGKKGGGVKFELKITEKGLIF